MSDQLRAHAESVAVTVDGGLGIAATAAVRALPRGARRDLEVAHWVRRMHAEVSEVALLIVPGMSEDELEAVIDLQVALNAGEQHAPPAVGRRGAL